MQYELCEDECVFFNSLLEQSQDLPHDFRIDRSSKDSPFNVTYNCGGYVGKIKLYLPPPKYAVLKGERKRAMRILDTIEEAETYMKENNGDRIEVRSTSDDRFMQVLSGLYTSKEFYFSTVEEYIEKIPLWIKYCKRHLNKL